MGIWAKNVHCPPAALSRSWFSYRWERSQIEAQKLPRILTGFSGELKRNKDLWAIWPHTWVERRGIMPLKFHTYSPSELHGFFQQRWCTTTSKQKLQRESPPGVGLHCLASRHFLCKGSVCTSLGHMGLHCLHSPPAFVGNESETFPHLWFVRSNC